MEAASGCRERTHKDKAFIFRQIGYLHQQRTHSEHRLCYQLLTAILGPISADFEWTASPDCGIASYQGQLTGGEIPGRILNMKEHPTMLLKTKGMKNGRREHPTIFMKTKLVIVAIPRC
jgi:hypothetical protein